MNNKEFNGKILKVRDVVSKSEREKELAEETLKYKKGCNFYVKNFSETTTEQDLRNLFAPFGEIESLKLFAHKDNKQPFAFVCFKTCKSASKVKKASLKINGRPLYINHYVTKQKRDYLKDRQDFELYKLMMHLVNKNNLFTPNLH
jgi:polyadenylate-binding protein